MDRVGSVLIFSSYGLNILIRLLNRSYLFHLKFDMIQLQLMVYFVSFNGWNSKLVSFAHKQFLNRKKGQTILPLAKWPIVRIAMYCGG